MNACIVPTMLFDRSSETLFQSKPRKDRIDCANNMEGYASGTIVRMPPRPGAAASGTAGSVGVAAVATVVDPRALLDSYDAANRRTTPGNRSSSSTGSQQLDPVAFLNQHYQTEAALTSQLGDLRDAVSQRMELLDDRIASALQRQSETAASTRQNIQDAKASISTLTERILLVQEKAAQSERAVLKITADMKMLDNAKRHLQKTITTLKRLHMLVHAVEELRVVKHKSDYAAASQLVQAIRILNIHFHQYQAKVPPLQKLAQTVDDLQAQLLHQVVLGFRRTALGIEKASLLEQQEMQKINEDSQEANPSSVVGREEDTSSMIVMTPDVMKGGVLFLDSLGDSVRSKFIKDFCRDLLRAYVEEFAPPKPEAEAKKQPEKRVSSFHVVQQPEPAEKEEKESKRLLDSVEQRFLWFRQLLEDEMQPKFGCIFPLNWHVQAILARTFLQVTHDHFLFLLRKGPRADATNATILLKALQKTIVFEKEITGWLTRECQTEFIANTGQEEEEKAPKPKNAIDPLIGVASVAFDNYMQPYIALEMQSMNEQLSEAAEDRSVDNRGERPVFISSTNLFVYIKGSITRCTNLTKSKPFLLLYQAFSESLRRYAHILNGKLPKASTASSSIPNISIAGLGKSTSSSGTTNDSSFLSNGESFKIPEGEEVTVCHVISTCEYCTDTVEALEELIRDTIDPKYQSKIDMMSDQDAFHDLTAKSIRVLVSGLTNRTQEALKQLSSINWGQWDSVGEESDYVLTLHKELEPFVTTVRSLLPTSYFRSFCDKFAASFTALYYDTVVKLKRISEPGTQQLLLDVYNLKTLFLKLPVLEESKKSHHVKKPSGGSTIAPAMYTKLVSKQFGKIETLLKLVGTPTDMLIENFKVQWVGGTAADLQSIMSLKQIKRPEQVVLLEKFGLDPAGALKGATVGISSTNIVSERVQSVTSDLSSMRKKMDSFLYKSSAK